MPILGISIGNILYIWQLDWGAVSGLIDVKQALNAQCDVPISGTFLMSPRSAFLPPLAAANPRSHSFSSARRIAAWFEISDTVTVAITAYWITDVK
jgi:hypothetical protein